MLQLDVGHPMADDPRLPAAPPISAFSTSDRCERARDRLALLVAASAVLSLALFIAAASLYPGGNHFDHHAAGHDFWRNAICDVARTTAIGGAPNGAAAWLARAAMSILAFGIGALYWLVPERFPSRARLGAIVRGLGAMTALGALCVVLVPPDRSSLLHGVAIMLGGAPGLVACLLVAFALIRERAAPRLVTVLAILALLVATAGLGLYVDELMTGRPPRLAVPVLERIAAILLLAFMLSASVLRRRPAGVFRRPRPFGRPTATDGDRR